MNGYCSIEDLRVSFGYNPRSGVLLKNGVEFGTINPKGYVQGSLKGKTVRAHRACWALFYGEWPDGEIDHINRVRHDNRICNLRVVTTQQNSRNRKKPSNNTSGYTGVSFHKASGKYIAYIYSENKLVHLGLYVTAFDAHKKREEKKIQLGYDKTHGL